MKECDILGVQT